MIDELVKHYKSCAADYAYDADVMREEDDRTARLKYILEHDISAAEKAIIVAYAELESYRDLGKLLGCSSVTARTQIERIRKKIHEVW